jgi:hypothetical protein
VKVDAKSIENSKNLEVKSTGNIVNPYLKSQVRTNELLKSTSPKNNVAQSLKTPIKETAPLLTESDSIGSDFDEFMDFNPQTTNSSISPNQNLQITDILSVLKYKPEFGKIKSLNELRVDSDLDISNDHSKIVEGGEINSESIFSKSIGTKAVIRDQNEEVIEDYLSSFEDASNSVPYSNDSISYDLESNDPLSKNIQSNDPVFTNQINSSVSNNTYKSIQVQTETIPIQQSCDHLIDSSTNTTQNICSLNHQMYMYPTLIPITNTYKCNSCQNPPKNNDFKECPNDTGLKQDQYSKKEPKEPKEYRNLNEIIINEFVTNHITLLQDFVEMNRIMNETFVETRIEYTTLEETREYIKRHRKEIE